MPRRRETNEYSPRHEEKINYHGPLRAISEKICREYGLGAFRSNKIIRRGYEDFNMRLVTSRGVYFVKIFAKHRDPRTPSIIVKAMELAMKAGVSTPKVHRSKKGYLTTINLDGYKLKACVTDFIEGRTFWELKKNLSISEIRFLARQAAKMNSINYKLVGGSGIWKNSWSRVNLPTAFRQRGRYLTNAERRLVKPAVHEFRMLKVRTLPRSFAHVDIAAANVIRDRRGRLWIVDFSGAYNYPRIFELAFFAKNFLVGQTKADTEANLAVALMEYQKILPLERREVDALPVVIKCMAASAIVFFRSFNALFGRDVPETNKEYLKRDRATLRQLSGG